MIVDADRNFIVAGAKYDLSLEDLEAWVAEGDNNDEEASH